MGDFWGEPDRAAPVRRVLETDTGLGGLRMGSHFLILVSSCYNNSFGVHKVLAELFLASILKVGLSQSQLTIP